MRYLTIIFSIIFFFIACSEKSNQPLRGTKAANLILGNNDREVVIWKLIQSRDPYMGGQVYIQDPGNPQYILMHRNGAFKEHDNVNVSFGNWYTNKEKNRLALVYYIQNGLSVPDERQIIDYRYEIQKVSQDSLILGIQGRHGIVKKIYINDPDAPVSIKTHPWEDFNMEKQKSEEEIWKN